MPGSGMRTFLEPDHGETALRQALIDTVITPLGQYRGRLTWADLHHVQLARCEEDLPRIAYLSLAPRLVFISFATGPGPSPVYRGTQLQAGEIMLHSLGERLHQATSGPAISNFIALDPRQLENYGRALSGKPLALPPAGGVLRPPSRDASRLARLHAQACRLAETKPKILAHPEVARAIEQGLIHALVTCLAAGKIRTDGAAKRHRSRIMTQLEEVFAEHLGKPLHMPELCWLVGVTDRTLRSCCAEFLDMSSQPVFTAAASEKGARRSVRGRPNANKCRGNCPALRLHRTRPVRRGLCRGFWGAPVSNLAAHLGHTTGRGVILPKLRSG